ncbi:MAG TPA: helix-turn-helix domain-containing protein [Epulopiscium sp.]|nr:helix-turn-helix domain-containing protein [Candidatus Epulonipiscium sp.]
MGAFYKITKENQTNPTKAFIHSVDTIEKHWHGEIDIIVVLEGSITVRERDKLYLLKENDLMLINSHEIHSLIKTSENNILLAVQINKDRLEWYYPKIKGLRFDCKSFNYSQEQQGAFDVIRQYVAKLVWDTSKKRNGYELTVASDTYKIIEHIMNRFDHYIMDEEEVKHMGHDTQRLQRIISFIDRNLDKGVTLKEIAENENLSISYLSRLIKNTMGITFQQYINNIRIDRAINLLYNTNQTITEVAYASGFPSSKAFNKLFKDIRGCTPTEYKKKSVKTEDINIPQVYKENKDKRKKTYLDVDRKRAFAKLFEYIKIDEEPAEEHITINYAKEVIEINAKSKGTPYIRYWQKLTSFSRASEGLRHNWQNQLKELQGEVGFEYIRFHGIFCDEMMICNVDEAGVMTYNWSYVNELFDLFKKQNIKPFVEFSFMPSELKSSDEVIFWWKANVSRPRDIKRWNDLVIAFIKHCMNRYGQKEVESWYFEVWNEPDFEYSFWIGSKEDYFEFYKETANAVKSVSKALRVGGPSIMQQSITDNNWLSEFLLYCNKNSVPLDFISLHIYPEIYDAQGPAQMLTEKLKAGVSMEEIMIELSKTKRSYRDKNNTYDAIKEGNRIIKETLPYKPEVHITEWNASAFNRNLIHDTCFVATYIISNVIRCLGKVDFLGYWNFTDIQEEIKAGISAFHGGFGLISKDGLKKPSYFAYYLLGKLGDEIIAKGEDYIVTKTGENLQVLACNHTYYDDLFLNGDASALTSTDRYTVYEHKLDKEIEINIANISGKYKVTRYELNKDHGSVFDWWLDMGAPEDMTEEEITYLKGLSYPKMEVKHINVDRDYKRKLYIPVHGTELITLEKQM